MFSTEERVPKYNNQEEGQGMWQMQPSHPSITLNFFSLQTLAMVPVLHFAIISAPDISFQSLLSLLGSISSHSGYFFKNYILLTKKQVPGRQ